MLTFPLSNGPCHLPFAAVNIITPFVDEGKTIRNSNHVSDVAFITVFLFRFVP